MHTVCEGVRVYMHCAHICCACFLSRSGKKASDKAPIKPHLTRHLQDQRSLDRCHPPSEFKLMMKTGVSSNSWNGQISFADSASHLADGFHLVSCCPRSKPSCRRFPPCTYSCLRLNKIVAM